MLNMKNWEENIFHMGKFKWFLPVNDKKNRNFHHLIHRHNRSPSTVWQSFYNRSTAWMGMVNWRSHKNFNIYTVYKSYAKRVCAICFKTLKTICEINFSFAPYVD